MGTNVVKLTDRAYMKQLRDRIDQDYREQLHARIRMREVSSSCRTLHTEEPRTIHPQFSIRNLSAN